MENLRIAIFQMNIVWEDKNANLAQLRKVLKKIDGKVDVIFLPEMSFTGFSMNIKKTREKDEETVRQVSQLAAYYKIAIGFGWTKEHDDKAENHYTVVDRNGIVISDYIKIHPFSFAGEDEYFNAGREVSVYEMKGIPICNFICYDLRFPEIFQIASDKAHIIIVPANWPAKRAEHWCTLLKARAIENQVYIIAVNCVGCIGGIEYQGDSCLINPNGEVLTISQKEEILIYEICDDVETYRRSFPVKDDRKNELYRLLSV